MLRRWTLPLVAVTPALLLAGCAAPGNKSAAKPPSAPPPRIFNNPVQPPVVKEIDAARTATRDDIVSIQQFWSAAASWLRDSASRVTGFQVPVYFVSGGTEKGTFVSGNISIRLFVIQPGASTDEERLQIQQWDLPPAEAMGFRVRRLSLMGYPYKFYLQWSSDLALAGREIEVEIAYHRADGRAVTSSSPRMRVPAKSKQPVPAGEPPVPATNPAAVSRVN